MELYSTNDVNVRWDNTVKYTTAWRTRNPDADVANQRDNWPNHDFGDLGFSKGDQINNRIDLLSELDVTYRNLGFRVSGAAWYDDVYAGGRNGYSFQSGLDISANTQAALLGGANNKLPRASRNIMGSHAEFSDAFVFGTFELGDSRLAARAGKHTVIYGESLFLGANAIAAAQGPVDLIKGWSIPTSQFKEIALPVNQISANWTINNDLSIGAYYQLQWKELRIPGVGSYFSFTDAFGPGGDLAVLGGGHLPVTRGPDFKGRDSGQWGAQVKFRIGDIDYGIYAARYDDKAPILAVNYPSTPPGGSQGNTGTFGTGTYNMMYARNIRVYGASMSTVIGGINVAGEISTRRNTPLQAPGDAVLMFAGMDNDRNTPYARGNSLHVNLSAIAVMAASPAWDAASLVAEYAFNRLLDVKWNPASQPTIFGGAYPHPLNLTHTRDAHAIRFVFQPEFFQVMPGVDIQVPIGVGYGLKGRSAVVSLLPEHSGDVSVGVNATIDRAWRVGASYVHYFGDAGSPNGFNGPGGTTPFSGSYKHYHGDRDFFSVSVQRTF
ncbi:MAG: DUF1302 domain-containing protein [Thauera sp.]|jgi:hypothetical protein|nr:DUF1302 domain-containing protein [Thauera sp.]